MDGGNYAPEYSEHCEFSAVVNSSNSNNSDETNVSDLKVLIADDDAVILKILVKCFKDTDHVTTVSDGDELLENLMNPIHQGVDLVLTDGHMPRVHGPDAAKELRRRGYVGRIVLLTGDIREGYGHDCGIDFFLHKPLKLAELLEILDQTRIEKKAQTISNQPTQKSE